MTSEENTKANQVAIMAISLLLGLITPLLITRTYDGVFGPRRRRLLHRLNAAHNLLYFILTLSTILVKIFIPLGNACWNFRFSQGLLFHAYVIIYELVIGIKAKAIVGNRIVIRFADLSVGSTLLLLSLCIRMFTTIMSIWHAEYVILDEFGLCSFSFDPIVQGLSNYTRNILEIFWSALFVIPLYRVVRGSKKAGAVAIVECDIYLPTANDPEKIGGTLSKSASAMQHLLVSSMTFPFCASLISIALSIYMSLNTNDHPAWASIMHGIQNNVSTLSLNLILNHRVAENEPVHSDNYDHVRTYDLQGAPNLRNQETGSFDEWENTDHETSHPESAGRKPSVVSFDLNHTYSPDTDYNGDISQLPANRRASSLPLHRDATPGSSGRSSSVTLPTTAPQTTANSSNAYSTMESLIPVQSTFPDRNRPESSSNEELFSSKL